MEVQITNISELSYQYTGDVSPFNNQYTARLIKPIDIEILAGDVPISFTIPVGFVTDFGTIPVACQLIVHPRGTSDRAFIVHDWLCVSQILPQIIIDKTLQQVMAMDGTPRTERNLAYIAVRLYDIFIRKHTKKNVKLLSNNEQILAEYFRHHPEILI